ncbi:MAG TPA: transcriptional regulator [Steroidobacteraceae bacterium]|nr:transcriptional regulator [Steroidobacteraceae bacterium]
MEGPDEIIHQSMRLRMTAALHAQRKGDAMEFSELKKLLGATDGNLATHLNALESAGYVEVAKDFVGRKPRTRITLSAAGRKAFARHVAYLRNLLDGE